MTTVELHGTTGASAAVRSVTRRIVGLPGAGAVALVRGYQLFVSPLTPPSCKYYPCCSSYSVTALRRFGLLRGVALTIVRLGRCNPWSKGGVDDVPDTWRLRARRTFPVPDGTLQPGTLDTDRSTTR